MREAVRSALVRMRNNPLGTALLVGLSFAYLYLFPYWPKINNPNENVRMYMTRAIVDHGTMAIGRRTRIGGRNQDGASVYDELGYVNDKALTCDDPSNKPPNCSGTLYSAKAPGTSYLGVPAYALAKTAYSALDQPLTKDATIYWLRLFSVVLPSILFLWVFYAWLGRFVPERWIRNIAIVGMGLGTMSYTYGQMFAGHQLAGLALFGALMAISASRERDRRWPLLALAGLLLASSVAFEYPTLLMTLPIIVFLFLSRPKLTGVLAFGVGALPPVIGVSAFHQVAFGAIHHTPYTTLENPGFVRDIAPGFMGIHAPTWEAFWGSHFVPFNGLFFFSPLMLLALPAAAYVIAWRLGRTSATSSKGRTEAAVALWVALAYSAFISCHSLWRGGWTLGPRYITGIVPFATFAIAVAARQAAVRAPRVVGVVLAGATAASVFVTFTCSLVSQGFPFEFFNPLTEVALPFVRDGYVARNVGNLLGLHGLESVLPLLVVVAALVVTALLQSPPGTPRASRASRASAAALLATAIAVGLTLPSTPWNKDKAEMVEWLQRRSVPPDQSRLVRERQELVKEERDLTPEQRIKLGNIYSEQGKSRQSLNQYRKAVAPVRTKP